MKATSILGKGHYSTIPEPQLMHGFVLSSLTFQSHFR